MAVSGSHLALVASIVGALLARSRDADRARREASRDPDRGGHEHEHARPHDEGPPVHDSVAPREARETRPMARAAPRPLAPLCHKDHPHP
ncbi:hypothetical protein ACTM8Z_07950 [Atopobiaceae bacterium HCP3S3_D6]